MTKYILGYKSNLRENHSIIFVSIITALCLSGDSMLYIALPLFWADVGLTSIWQIGVLLSINRFIRLITNPIVGYLYKKMDIRVGLSIAIILSVLTTAGYAVASGIVVWVILRILWGCAWSLLRLGAYLIIVRDSPSNQRGKYIGTYNGLFRTGSLIGMLFGGMMVSISGMFLVSCLFAILAMMALPLLPFISKGCIDNAGYSSEKGRWRKTIFKKEVLEVLVSGLLLSMLINGILKSTLSYVIDYHFTGELILYSFVIGAAALSGVLQSVRWVSEFIFARFIGNWSDGSRGRLPLLLIALVVSAFSFIGILLQLPVSIWIIFPLLSFVAATGLITLIDTITTDVASQSDARTVMTWHSILLDLGASLGPALSYVLIEVKYGLNILYIGGAIIFALLFIWWRIRHTKELLQVKNNYGIS